MTLDLTVSVQPNPDTSLEKFNPGPVRSALHAGDDNPPALWIGNLYSRHVSNQRHHARKSSIVEYPKWDKRVSVKTQEHKSMVDKKIKW